MNSELFGSLFYLRKDTFDAVASAVCLGSVIETESVERVLERPRTTDKEGGDGHVAALLELAEELEVVRSLRIINSLSWRNTLVSGSTAANSQHR